MSSLTLNAAGTVQGVAGSAASITCTIFGDEISGGTDSFKKLYQGTLPSSAGVLYTVPGATQAVISTIMLANTTAGAVTATLFVDGTAAANRIVSLSVPAGGTATWAGDGWSVQDASGAALTTTAVVATGDATGMLAGGVLPLTLVTVNPNVGSFGSASSVGTQTVNAKGLTTAAGSTPILITASQVSNFDTQVRTNRLDQMATPTADVSMGSFKITTLADGTNANDAATLGQVQAAAEGRDDKEAVEWGTTGNITLSGLGTQGNGEWTGTLTAGDRILVKAQSSSPASGIYAAAAGAWTRTLDANTGAEITGATVLVKQGATLRGDTWRQSATVTTIGTDPQTWVQIAEGDPITLTAVGAVPNAQGATLAGQALTLQPANGSFPGLLSAAGFTALSTQSGTNTGDVTLAAVAAVPNANAATLTGQVLNLQPASASFPGVITSAQFVILSNTSGTNSGNVSLGAVGASPNANAATLTGQVLNLELASASQPGVITAAQFTKLANTSGTNTGDQNLFASVTGNTGTATADTTTDSLSIVGVAPISTVATDGPEVITISSALATTTTPGDISAVEKTRLNGIQYDFVADFGGVGNDSTDNLTMFNNAISGMASGSTLYIPPGTYRVSGEITIAVDKKITFRGRSRYSSIIKTTSATANIFNISAVAWRNTWIDLGFLSTVNKTAGACIAITLGQAATFPTNTAVGNNVYRCWFSSDGGGSIFQAINYTGWQAGNLSVLSDLDISGISNGGRGIFLFGSTINIQIHNTTINCGAATTSACCEIQASGAVQVTSFDWIQGTNCLILNAATQLGAQACYFTNGFFDQPQASVIRVIGGFTTGRIKFTQCGIATATSGFHGIEVAGTGAGAVGTATALPAGISVVDCDMYHAAGSSTGNGIFVNGCQDINIQNTRITGYSGAGGCAIRVTPSASNQTKVRVNGNILGPNSNLTVTNTVGVQIDAGSSGCSVLSITDNTMTGSTTAIVDNGTAFADQQKNINNNAGAVSGFSAQAVPNSTVLTTVETVVMVVPLPPNSMKVGTTALLDLNFKPLATTVSTIRFRVGPSATVPATNTALAAVADLTSLAVKVARAQMGVTVAGGSAAFIGNGVINNTTITATSGNTAASGTFNGTVQNYLMVTLTNTSSTTTTVYSGGLEVISPS